MKYELLKTLTTFFHIPQLFQIRGKSIEKMFAGSARLNFKESDIKVWLWMWYGCSVDSVVDRTKDCSALSRGVPPYTGSCRNPTSESPPQGVSTNHADPKHQSS